MLYLLLSCHNQISMNVRRTQMAVLRCVLTQSPAMPVLVVLAIVWQMIVMDVMVTNYNGKYNIIASFNITY